MISLPSRVYVWKDEINFRCISVKKLLMSGAIVYHMVEWCKLFANS